MPRTIRPLATIIIVVLLVFAVCRNDLPRQVNGASWAGVSTTQPRTQPATSADVVAPTSARPATSPATTPAVLMPGKIRGIENFAKVSDILYRGEQPTAEGFEELKKLGIKTIINLRALHSDRDQIKGLGFRYLHVSCKAWHPEDEDTLAVLKALENPDNHPVFIHCQRGADRTGCIVGVYRIMYHGWTADEAIKEMLRFGFDPIWGNLSAYLKNLDPQAIRKQLGQTQEPKVEVVN